MNAAAVNTSSSQVVSWARFDNLKISGEQSKRYLEFVSAIEELKSGTAGPIDFILLSGNATAHGEEAEYRLVSSALRESGVPFYAIPSETETQSASLDLFRKYLCERTYSSFDLRGCHFAALNSFAKFDATVFGLGLEQLAWLCGDLQTACENGLNSVVFLHAHPNEHGGDAPTLLGILAKNRVLLVETTPKDRSESVIPALQPIGFTVTSIHRGVVSRRVHHTNRAVPPPAGLSSAAEPSPRAAETHHP